MSVEGIISPCLLVHHRARLRPDARLWEDLAIDGVMLVGIAVEIEDFYSIRVPDTEIDKWVTVSDIEASVQQACSGSDGTLQEAPEGG